jgi:hypothetical protein
MLFKNGEYSFADRTFRPFDHKDRCIWRDLPPKDEAMMTEVLDRVYVPVFGERQRALEFLSLVRRALSGERVLVLCKGGSDCGGSTIGNFVLDTFKPYADIACNLLGRAAPDKYAIKGLNGVRLVVFNHVPTSEGGSQFNRKFLQVAPSVLAMCNSERMPYGAVPSAILDMPNKFANDGGATGAYCLRPDVIAANVHLALSLADPR